MYHMNQNSKKNCNIHSVDYEFICTEKVTVQPIKYSLHHLVLLVACFLFTLPRIGNAASLSEALFTSFHESSNWLQTKLILSSQEKANDKLKSALLPNLDLQATYQNNPQMPQAKSNHFTEMQAIITQPLYDQKAWHTFKGGKIYGSQLQLQHREYWQNFIVQVHQQYIEVLKAKINVETQNVLQKQLKKQFEHIEKKYKYSVATKVELLEARASLSSTNAALLSAQTVYQQVLSLLESLLNQSVTIPEINKFSEGVVSIDALANVIDISLNHDVYALMKYNLSIEIQKLNAELFEKNIDIASSARLPRLNLSYALVNNSIMDSTEGVTSISANWKLFSSGNIKADVQEKEYLYQSELAKLKAEKEFFYSNTQALITNIINDAMIIKSRQQSLKANEASVKALQLSYNEGQRTLTDVLVGQTNLQRAQQDFYVALLDHKHRIVLLAQALARLDVKLVDWLYD